MGFWERIIEVTRLQAVQADLRPQMIDLAAFNIKPAIRAELIPLGAQKPLVAATVEFPEVTRMIAEEKERARLIQQERDELIASMEQFASNFEGSTILEIPTSTKEGFWLPERGTAKFWGYEERGIALALPEQLTALLTDAAYEERLFHLVSLDRKDKPIDALDIIRRGTPFDCRIRIARSDEMAYLMIWFGDPSNVLRDRSNDRFARTVLVFAGRRAQESQFDPNSRLILDFKTQ